MRTIRASEIASYKFCQRAWWYQMNGHPPDNQPDLDDGMEMHERHGRRVYLAGFLRVVAYALVLLALVTLAVELTMQLL
jgi:hypothetical protein